VIVFDGRLDNREELLPKLKASSNISRDSPDTAFVLAAYDVFGDNLAGHLIGDFALGLFDPSRKKLLLARDAIGVRPLYYCQSGKTFLFASEIKALLVHPGVSTRPNDDVLAQFLISGQPQNDRGFTFFEGVYGLPPAHIAVITPEGFARRQYWDFDATQQIRLKSFDEYAEVFRHHFGNAVQRRLRSAYPVAVSVSGGLDSSSIFCIGETLRRRIPGGYSPLFGISCTSPDGTPADEKRFLLDIEEKYGIVITKVLMGPMGFMIGSRKAIWHVEAPFQDSEWNRTNLFLDTVRRTGARLLLTGHWGDQLLFNQGYLVDLFNRLSWGKVRTHLKEFCRWNTDVDPGYFRRLFFKDLLRHHVPVALMPFLRRVKGKLSRTTQDHPWYTKSFRKRAHPLACQETLFHSKRSPVHARSLYNVARSGYYVLCMEWNNKVAAMYGLEYAFPFLDRDLISFLIGIPGEIQMWKGVPKGILREALRGLLPTPILERRWKADYTDPVNEGMEREYPEVVDCLQSHSMAVQLGYVNGDVLRNGLTRAKDRIRGPDCLVTWSLRDLVALELWLQVFFEEKENKKGKIGT